MFENKLNYNQEPLFPSGVTGVREALYHNLAPDETMFDHISRFIVNRPKRRFEGFKADDISRQKHEAMKRYPHLPQFIFDLAEAKARTGQEVSFSDMVQAGVSGAGQGAGQALIKAPLFMGQGINESYLNPIGVLARGYHYIKGNGFTLPTPTLSAESVPESVLAKATKTGFEMGMGAMGLKGLAPFIPTKSMLTHPNRFVRGVGRVADAVTTPLPIGYEIASGMGAGGLSEMVQPETTLGQVGTALAGGILAPTALWGGQALTVAGRKLGESVSVLKNTYDIGKQYDHLLKDPLRGQATDVITKIRVQGEEPVFLRRGAAMIDDTGRVVTSGRTLSKTTGTSRNYGLNKIIYKHDITKDEARQIPQILRQYEPSEINPMGQKIYVVDDGAEAPLVIATSSMPEGRNIVSMYRDTTRINRPLSIKKDHPQSRMSTCQAQQFGYTTGDYYFVPVGEGVQSIMGHNLSNVKKNFGLSANFMLGRGALSIGSDDKATDHPQSRMSGGQAEPFGYATGDSSFVPVGEGVDSIMGHNLSNVNEHMTPSPHSISNGQESSVGSDETPNPSSDLSKQMLFEQDMSPQSYEKLQNKGYNDEEILELHRLYDDALIEQTIPYLQHDVAKDALPYYRQKLHQDLERLKSRSRSLGHHFYQDPPSVQTGMLAMMSDLGPEKFRLRGYEMMKNKDFEVRYDWPALTQGYQKHDYLAMSKESDRRFVSKEHNDRIRSLYRQGNLEIRSGIHGGPYYDSLSDYWETIKRAR